MRATHVGMDFRRLIPKCAVRPACVGWQRRMANSNVLVVGVNGLGAEVAKNIILAGVKSVTLLDDAQTSWEDLSAQVTDQKCRALKCHV